MIPKILKNFNLFVDGRGFVGRVEEVNPPKLTIKTEEFRGGGMDAPASIDMGMEKMEASFTLAEYDKEVLKQFGLISGNAVQVTLRGAMQDDETTSPIVIKLRGMYTEMDMGKFGLSVNGGAYLNLLFRQSGDFLSPETLTPTPLNPEDPNTVSVFKRQAGVGYYGSVALTYATKSGLELLIEPHFKMFPNSVTQDQFAVQQRHMNAGVFMGIRKHL